MKFGMCEAAHSASIDSISMAMIELSHAFLFKQRRTQRLGITHDQLTLIS